MPDPTSVLGPGSLPRRVARRLARVAGAPVARRRAAIATRAWEPYSRLFALHDDAGWAVSDEREIAVRAARSLGIEVADQRLEPYVEGQSVLHFDQFRLLSGAWRPSRNRLGVALYHGLPGTGVQEFDDAFRTLERRHESLSRVRVTHAQMRDVVLETGIDPSKVHLIRIGVDVGRLVRPTDDERAARRAAFGLPDDAFVVGSLVKDGVGWGDGLEPKAIKGPDVLVAALEQARSALPTLAVLLTGPARGYVKRRLDELGIPYRHVVLPSPDDVATVYPALDAAIVASRQEGGPKSVLEAMATGVPIVSTRVGQAADLIVDGWNGFLADVEDAAGLAATLVRAAERRDDASLLDAARATAQENDHRAQRPLWAAFFDGFVGRR